MKRILFVDDEKNLLDGVRRMLRSQRREWEMAFASSGQEALALFSEQPYDVIVTDMKMPGMNGAQLLAQIAEGYPRTIRIVLSGQTEMEVALRCVFVSHQFLAKPCDADSLRDIIKRACQLEEFLHEINLRKLLGGVVELPVLPRVYQSLAAELAKDDVDVKAVGRLVEQDPGVAAKILQLVNSSFFGLRRELNNLTEATTYLGVNTIRDLVLSFELFKEHSNSQLPGFSTEREQRHSLVVGRIARRFFDEKILADQAFLAGMLHGVGRLVLANKVTERYREVLEAKQNGQIPTHVIEQQVMGVTHAQVGAYLLGLWGLPYPLIEAVGFHCAPSAYHSEPKFGLLTATHVANCLALEQEGFPAHVSGLDEAYLKAAGVFEKLPEWRSIASEETQVEAEAA